MLKKLDNSKITSRLIILAITPVIVMAMLIGYYVNNARNNDLAIERQQRGNLMVESLAAASEFSVATNNIEQLKSVVDAVITRKDVVGVKIDDDSGNSLYERININDANNAGVSKYQAPIRPTLLENDDLFELESTTQNKPGIPETIGTAYVFLSNQSYLERQKNILVTTIGIILAGVILSLMFAYIIGRSMTAPIDRVVKTVAQMTQGDMSARIREIAEGELGELQLGINKMAEKVERSQDELENKVAEAVAELQVSVEELEVKNTQLDVARHEAMQAKDAKSEFLANMSHEIRTPLNAVIGFSRQLTKTTMNSQQGEYTRMINSAARQLLTVIDDILGFAKLDSGTMEIRNVDYKLRKSLEDTVLLLAQSAHEKNLEFVLLISSDVPDYVNGDPLRLGQVVTNLANNAIKFTDHGSVVVNVTMSDDERYVRIGVVDTGCGIDAKAQENLFTEFYQAEAQTSKRHSGTGLGLVICKKLIQMMGGEIGFSSQQGGGSEFYITIPALSLTSIAPASAIVAEGVNVLLLDEHIQSRRSIRNALVHAGANTYAFDRVGKLTTFIKKSNLNELPDCIFLSLPISKHNDTQLTEYMTLIRRHYSGRCIVLVAGMEHELIAPDNNTTIIQRPVRQKTLMQYIENTATDETKEAPKSTTEHQYRNIRALVAEDNEFNRVYINDLLEGMLINVTCVENGQLAVEACKTIHYDIIFLDLHMPELDGLDAMSAIRKLNGVNKRTPIIAITADVFSNDDNKLVNLGFSDCMFKPVEEQRLIAIMDNWCTRNNDKKSAQTKKVHHSGMDADILKRLVDSMTIHIAELRHEIANDDINTASETVHKILGLVCYFKMDKLTEQVRGIQDAIRSNDVMQANSLLNSLEDAVTEISAN